MRRDGWGFDYTREALRARTHLRALPEAGDNTDKCERSGDKARRAKKRTKKKRKQEEGRGRKDRRRAKSKGEHKRKKEKRPATTAQPGDEHPCPSLLSMDPSSKFVTNT